MAEYQAAPFLKQARGKDPDERNLFEKIAVGIYGKEDPSLTLGSDLLLDESFDDIIETLPGEVQDDVSRYKNIFKETPIVLENFLNEYKEKGFSDYIEKGTFYKEDIELSDKDQRRYQDYNFLGKGSYDALYRKDKAGDEARQKVAESIPGQLIIGPTVGLATAIKGTSELVASLSDLYLDTEILDNVEKAFEGVDINEIYKGDAGTLARFTSLLTQYGTNCR